MKKLYRRGTTVHPSPSITADHLSFLPATILTLVAALSPDDKQVLAYLISCSNNDFGNFSSRRKNTPKTQARTSGSGSDRLPLFTCDCFRCYTSYWVRWVSSPNRQLIHDIVDSFEDEVAQSKKTKSKKERKKRGGSADYSSRSLKKPEEDSGVLKTIEPNDGEGSGDVGEGSVRRLVNFIGERIWNVWGK
ncbi:Carboxylesterase [Hibiscus syriacus]|uniref:Carboxylesterase n=1 Tax=Hibiscus syriacus TaxID=106335 RepID=A0A6A3AWY3_HIBSY|nr:uncharacterized protein LOC120119389 [Hibiscus syriacus]KAE8708926.1 Carboxylesterase [Hibiscus syriacus]